MKNAIKLFLIPLIFLTLSLFCMKGFDTSEKGGKGKKIKKKEMVEKVKAPESQSKKRKKKRILEYFVSTLLKALLRLQCSGSGSKHIDDIDDVDNVDNVDDGDIVDISALPSGDWH